jgi:two-component system response regulator HydG
MTQASTGPQSGKWNGNATRENFASGEGRAPRIAIVDDDPEMRSLLEDYFRGLGHQVATFDSAPAALNALDVKTSESADKSVDLVISDIKMPQMDGLAFVDRLKLLHPEIPVILITAFGSIETAIDAMKRGAFHYIVKPFKLAEVGVQAARALEHRRLLSENLTLRSELQGKWSLGNVVGKSPQMKAVFDLVSRVSHANANVLITGESGTGKEMIARAIHNLGPRAGRPFVAINCTAIPETLLESELFGHAKGSFTGAIQRKKGLFEEAEGGTLFLDEIGDMDVLLQSKLLRVLQEKKVRAVGDNVSKDVDVRIVAATHKDLKLAMKEGRFRDDLYYRLSVIPLVVPPLRDRKDDIPLLASHFLKKAAAANGVKIQGFTKRAVNKLLALRWEGNVRELENMVERAVVLAQGTWIDEIDIPSPDTIAPDQFFSSSTQDWPTLTQLEIRYMRLVLEKTGGRKDKAAQILGINRRTLYRKEREYGFVPADSSEESSESALFSDELDTESPLPLLDEAHAPANSLTRGSSEENRGTRTETPHP